MVDYIYSHMKEDIHKFDTTDFQPNNISHISLVNQNVLKLMKDENNGVIMTDFFSL